MLLRFFFGFIIASNLSFGMQLQVVEYNIDKNGVGGDGSNERGAGPQIELLKRNIGNIDILVLIEANQNCAASNHSDGPEIFRQALNLSSGAYAAEFKEEEGYQCITGNAILSKYPMELIGSYPYRSQCWLVGDRKGARNMLVTKIYPDNLHPKKGIYVIATHLEAGTGSMEGVRNGMLVRAEQGAELADYIQTLIKKNNCVLVLGDFNSPDINFLNLNDAVKSLKRSGLANAHQSLTESRTTLEEVSWIKALKIFQIDAQLDYIFYGGDGCTMEAPQIIRDPDFMGASDHFPITAKLLTS